MKGEYLMSQQELRLSNHQALMRLDEKVDHLAHKIEQFNIFMEFCNE